VSHNAPKQAAKRRPQRAPVPFHGDESIRFTIGKNDMATAKGNPEAIVRFPVFRHCFPRILDVIR
jgi:hypothetical protein